MKNWIVADAHHHLGDLSANYYPWLTDRQNLGINVKPFAHNYGVRDYLCDAEGVGLAKSMHVQAGFDPSDPVAETQWLSEVADRDGYPHAIVAYIDLSSDFASRLIKAHTHFSLVRGIRMHLTWRPEAALRRAVRSDYLEHKNWWRGLSALTESNLSFDRQIYPIQMKAAAAIVGHFSSTAFIIDHLGLPVEPRSSRENDWEEGLRRLAGFENMAIKLSGFSHFMPAWSRKGVRRYIDFAIDAFGHDWCLLGSNYPVDRPFAPYRCLVNDIRSLLEERRCLG